MFLRDLGAAWHPMYHRMGTAAFTPTTRKDIAELKVRWCIPDLLRPAGSDTAANEPLNSHRQL